MRLRSKTTSILVAACLTIPLVGCSTPTAPAVDDGVITVVASTNVYGDIAKSLGGEKVEVVSIIEDMAQDPHSFEADARVQLALSKADLIIENGGGYDFYVQTMLSGAGNDDATLLNASRLSEYDLNAPDFNEHVWYDVNAMEKVAEAITAAYSGFDPASKGEFEKLNTDFTKAMDVIKIRQSTLQPKFDGRNVAITEPLPGYLLHALRLNNVTPSEFFDAVEEGSEVPPAILHDTLSALGQNNVEAVFYNEQTSGVETEQLKSTAERWGIPVVAISEILPPNTDYATWMTGLLDAIETALEAE